MLRPSGCTRHCGCSGLGPTSWGVFASEWPAEPSCPTSLKIMGGTLLHGQRPQRQRRAHRRGMRTPKRGWSRDCVLLVVPRRKGGFRARLEHIQGCANEPWWRRRRRIFLRRDLPRFVSRRAPARGRGRSPTIPTRGGPVAHAILATSRNRGSDCSGASHASTAAKTAGTIACGCRAVSRWLRCVTKWQPPNLHAWRRRTKKTHTQRIIG